MALLDTYETERGPIGRMVLRFTDRAARVATSERRILRLLRTQLVPRLAPLVLRSPARERTATDPRTAPHPLPRQPGRPRRTAGPTPRPEGRRPSSRRPHRPRWPDGWLQDAVAAPSFHLLLCGPTDDWDADHLAALQERYGGLIAVHRLTRETASEVIRDRDGQAFARLGVEHTAQYLVRPDGHIGYRSGGTTLGGVDRYLARWLPGAGREPQRSSREAPTTKE